jgi:hypothetical protein
LGCSRAGRTLRSEPRGLREGEGGTGSVNWEPVNKFGTPQVGGYAGPSDGSFSS